MIRAAGVLLALAFLAGCVDNTIPEREVVSDACTATLPQAYAAQVPNDGSHDPALVSGALTAIVNEERCRAGLAPVSDNPALAALADSQAERIAATGIANHGGGNDSLAARLRAANIPFSDARENLLTGFFVEYIAGTEYRIVDEENCVFTYGNASGFLPRHSYESLARESVRDWLASDGHRGNMLAPGMTAHGGGMAPTAETALCGGLAMVQILIR
ncbi:MAG: CAP domain-containing protein [Rubricella sp.]